MTILNDLRLRSSDWDVLCYKFIHSWRNVQQKFAYYYLNVSKYRKCRAHLLILIDLTNLSLTTAFLLSNIFSGCARCPFGYTYSFTGVVVQELILTGNI